jgi:hypothetical protein
MSLIGGLDEMKLADVFRILAGGRKSGLLTVTARGDQALVRFLKGEIVNASAGRLLGDDAVLDLFGWREGQLTFVPEERSVTPNVGRSVEALIEEGLRVGEFHHRMRELIPSDRVVFQMAPGPSDESVRYTIGVKEWRVLRALDGVRDVREVIEASKVGRDEVLRILFEMAQAGFLHRAEVQKLLRAQPHQGLFTAAAASVDERIGGEWTRFPRFSQGVQRVEIRTVAGRHLVLPASFKANLAREVHLPKASLVDLGIREGEEVYVRPVG